MYHIHIAGPREGVSCVDNKETQLWKVYVEKTREKGCPVKNSSAKNTCKKRENRVLYIKLHVKKHPGWGEKRRTLCEKLRFENYQ